MDYKKIMAVVRTTCLESVEDALQGIGIEGVMVTRVKGYGEYANFSRGDWFCSHARIEIFTEQSRVQETVDAIIDAANTGRAGDGIVVVLPVDKVYRIREGETTGDERGEKP